ncbi:hypothetical protein N7532_002947 [Penicillium argentinense]|uniref:NDT80 domain-containing protein n=1 Tax=Penicillium argentinense TaxID=1131581 RepID=A0A9W9G2W8_9EURO|nr:uncharacterized protein N7532_002947 [Penicillium argentinense]KAJ5110302.1 hypothetical protein N7532_002947 [Penicillium argentinense]
MSALGDESAGHVPETWLDFLPMQATPDSILYGKNGQRVSFLPRARLGGRFLLAKEPLEGGNDGDFLTCYRRNLFSVAGLLSIDEWPTWALPSGMVRDPSGQDSKITGLFARLKAVESWDSTEVTITSGANRSNATTERGARPADIPLLPPSRDGDASGTSSEHLEIQFSWERLQFRSATANNGKRRKEIRQQFKVIIAILGSKEDGTCILIAELASSFLTVRGRSPKSFAASEASQVPGLDLYQPENDVTGLDMHLPGPSASDWTSTPEVSFFDPYASYIFSDPSQELVYSQTMWDWMNPSVSLLTTSTSILDTEQPMEQEADIVCAGYESQHCVTDTPDYRQLSGHHLMSMAAPCRQGAIAELNPDEVSWAPGLHEGPGHGLLPADSVSISAFTPDHSALPEHTSSPRGATTSTVSVEGQTSDASKKQRTEPNSTPRTSGEIQSRYKYIPIGISGWQPPIEPVYWPHPWSHIVRGSEVIGDLYRTKPYYTHLEHKRVRV